MTLALCLALSLAAVGEAPSLAQAHDAYDRGDFAAAADAYAALAEAHDAPELHYDLGNAALRAGQLGRAIAAYHRAAAAAPRDPDVAANLAYARARVEDALAPPAPSRVVDTLFFWHYGLSRTELAWTVALLNLLVWTCLGAARLLPSASALRAAGLVLAVPLVAAAASLAVRTAAPRRIAVVAAPEANIYSGTGADTVVRFTLRDGAELRWLTREGEWVRVALPDGEQGWGQLAELALVER